MRLPPSTLKSHIPSELLGAMYEFLFSQKHFLYAQSLSSRAQPTFLLFLCCQYWRLVRESELSKQLCQSDLWLYPLLVNAGSFPSRLFSCQLNAKARACVFGFIHTE